MEYKINTYVFVQISKNIKHIILFSKLCFTLISNHVSQIFSKTFTLVGIMTDNGTKNHWYDHTDLQDLPSDFIAFSFFFEYYIEQAIL